MTRGMVVTNTGPRQRTVVFTPWPSMPKLMRLTRLLCKRRRGYHNPLCIDGHEYHRRTRARRKR